jgi:hypothetical protein
MGAWFIERSERKKNVKRKKNNKIEKKVEKRRNKRYRSPRLKSFLKLCLEKVERRKEAE